MKRIGWQTWVGAAVLGLSIAGLALVPSQVLSPRFGARSIAFSPSAFPVLSLSLLAFLAALMLLRARLAATPDVREPPGGRLQARVLVPMGTFLVYVLLIEPLGMYAATGLAVIAFAFGLGTRNWLIVAALATATPLFIWIFFERTLGVLLPKASMFGGVF
jgi:hypothetical protein